MPAPALALPLLVSFAEAAGITISAIATAAGIDKLSDKVEEYIEDNPENAQKIFAMIMPEQGIASVLKNKSDDGGEVSEEELGEIEEPKLTGKEKGMRIKEAIRRARGEKGLPARGNYSSPDAEGPAVDIRGSVIREVEDMGIADKDLKDNYDPNKKKFNYKKYFKKADGGIMGSDKTYHQVRDQFMPMDSESMGYANGGGVGSMMQRKSFNQGSNWWDTLDSQGMGVYNSMKRGGHDDATIQGQLSMLGYYDPNAAPPDSTPDTPVVQQLGYQGGGNDRPYAGQVVDQTDYGFNKKNYAPGEKLEINPAAFGVSFPDQPSGPKREGIRGLIDSFTSLPTRSLSSFASPTTGGNITGPAEQGFMSQVVSNDPAGRTREELMSSYDDYNRFIGRSSNYADARVKGKAGQMIGNVIGGFAGVPFLGTGIDMLGGMGGGDKSLQGKYTVDNAGFGNTGARDEFGLPTFNKKDGFLGLKGNTTRDYSDRMNERLGELTDFFGSRIEGFDINNLTPDMLANMKRINGFYTKQVQAYKDRTEVENLNRQQKDKEQAEKIAKQQQESAFQAQLNQTQRQQRMQDLQRIERAYRQDTGGRGGSYATGESGVQSDGSYNDPFDPGGGE